MTWKFLLTIADGLNYILYRPEMQWSRSTFSKACLTNLKQFDSLCLLFYPISFSYMLFFCNCFPWKPFTVKGIAAQALEIQTLHTYTHAAVITVSWLVTWTVVRAWDVDTGGIDGAVMWTIGTFIHVLELKRSVWEKSICSSSV